MRPASVGEAVFPRAVPVAILVELAAIYAVLVIYGIGYEYFFAHQLTPLFHDDFTTYDFTRQSTYRITEFVTPLALLPMGTRLRSPGQIIAATLAIFLFIPIPLTFIPQVSDAEYWRIYALLWLAFFAVSVLSSLAVAHRIPTLSEGRFRHLVYALTALFAVGLAYCAITNHVQFVSLLAVHEARVDVATTSFQTYILLAFGASFGGFLFGMALMYRKLSLAVLSLVGFAICYGILFEKTPAVAPFWIAYVYLAQRYLFRDSMLGLFVTMIAPFLTGVVLYIVGGSDRASLIYTAFTLANYRLYAVPALAFAIYYNFFHMHALTYWSHVNLIARFVSFPYAVTIPQVISVAYQTGSYNASFLETDALAAAGPAALPYIGAVFGLILVGINSCMRGINLTLCAIVMASPAIVFVDTGIGPGLLSNGVLALSLVFLFAPRDASWNVSRLLRSGSRLAVPRVSGPMIAGPSAAGTRGAAA